MEIVNKVAESGLVTIDLESFLPKEEVVVFDMKDHLFMGLILKEKDFRAALPAIDWAQYENKIVALTCSADAIIPVWAYMLVVTQLNPYTQHIVFGDADKAKENYILQNIAAVNVEDYADKRIVIKGCGEVKIPDAAYVAITNKIKPVAKSIMYGEPCSTVPVYKKR